VFPPILSGLDEVPIEPEVASVVASAPFTYNRTALPSYVVARCVHTFAGITGPGE